MENYRILIIDDVNLMHEDFKNILTPKKNDATGPLQELKTLLFDAPKDTDSELPPFVLSSALQGEEGIELVRQALEKREPYALAFVDILMPPGLDGIKTISKIWEIDPYMQIVICTAYAKYSWEEIRKELKDRDNLFILKKPFDRIEVLQLACALTKKWNILKNIQGIHTPSYPTTRSEESDIDATIVTLRSNMQDLENILKRF